MSITVVNDNPNPHTLVIRLGSASLLGNVEKIVLTQSTPSLESICGFAAQILSSAKFISRVDLYRTNDFCDLSMTTKFNWTHQNTQQSKESILNFLKQTAKGFGQGAPIINSDVASRILSSDDALNRDGQGPKAILTNGIANVFEQAVNPTLQKDGGAMSLSEVTIDRTTGEIKIALRLMGACSGCNSAQDTTLKHAFSAIVAYIDEIKKPNPGLSALTVSPFALRESPQGFISLRR